MMGGRRDALQWLALAGTAALAGCAGLSGREPVRVNVVAFEPAPGEGMEVRGIVKLRVQNPNDLALDYDGIAIELDVNGNTFASGVSGERGSIPRFGEAVIAVPVSISALSMLRQALGLASGGKARVGYALRGRLAAQGARGTRFDTTGDIDLGELAFR